MIDFILSIQNQKPAQWYHGRDTSKTAISIRGLPKAPVRCVYPLITKNQNLNPNTDTARAELQTTIASRQKLEAQKQENLGVKKEFDKLQDEETIYKLVGPVLLKQDKVEAEGTVNGRLEFIGKEM